MLPFKRYFCLKSCKMFRFFSMQEKQKKEAYDLAKLEMLTGGFLDTAALESNAALLALLLKQATNDGFFWTVVALVVVAVCLQVAIGVILAFRVSTICFKINLYMSHSTITITVCNVHNLRSLSPFPRSTRRKPFTTCSLQEGRTMSIKLFLYF